MEDGRWGVTPNFESWPTKDHFSSNFSAEDLYLIFFSYDMHNLYKLTEKRI